MKNVLMKLLTRAKWFNFVVCLICISCSSSRLSVREEFFDKEQLASVKVHTPDPLKEGFQSRQRLIVNWKLPYSVKNKSVKLLLYVRFADKEEAIIEHDINRLNHYFIYDSPGKEIKMYKAKILIDGQKQYEWNHLLWADRIGE